MAHPGFEPEQRASEYLVSHELHDWRIKVPSPAKEETYICNVKTSPGAQAAP